MPCFRAMKNLRRAAAEALANDPVEGHAMLKEGATLDDIMLRRAVVHGLSRVGQPWAVEMLQQHAGGRRPVGSSQPGDSIS